MAVQIASGFQARTPPIKHGSDWYVAGLNGTSLEVHKATSPLSSWSLVDSFTFSGNPSGSQREIYYGIFSTSFIIITGFFLTAEYEYRESILNLTTGVFDTTDSLIDVSDLGDSGGQIVQRSTGELIFAFPDTYKKMGVDNFGVHFFVKSSVLGSWNGIAMDQFGSTLSPAPPANSTLQDFVIDSSDVAYCIQYTGNNRHGGIYQTLSSSDVTDGELVSPADLYDWNDLKHIRGMAIDNAETGFWMSAPESTQGFKIYEADLVASPSAPVPVTKHGSIAGTARGGGVGVHATSSDIYVTSLLDSDINIRRYNSAGAFQEVKTQATTLVKTAYGSLATVDLSGAEPIIRYASSDSYDEFTITDDVLLSAGLTLPMMTLSGTIDVSIQTFMHGLQLTHVLNAAVVDIAALQYLMSIFNVADGELFVPLVGFTIRRSINSSGNVDSHCIAQAPVSFRDIVSARLTDTLTLYKKQGTTQGPFFAGVITEAFNKGNFYSVSALETSVQTLPKTVNRDSTLFIRRESGGKTLRMVLDPLIKLGDTVVTPEDIITVDRMTIRVDLKNRFMELKEDA